MLRKRGKIGFRSPMGSSAGCRFENRKSTFCRYRSLVYASQSITLPPPLLLNIPIRELLTRAHLHIGTPSAFLFSSPLFLKLASRHFCTPPVPLLLEVLDCRARALLFFVNINSLFRSTIYLDTWDLFFPTIRDGLNKKES